MVKEFIPDYNNIVLAACNKQAPRLPLYEHIICDDIMEKIMNVSFKELINGNDCDLDEYFRNYCSFFKLMGYDTVSFECCITDILPDGGCLGGHKTPAIRDRADFERYPWDEVEKIYFEKFSARFRALGRNMPDGMKAIGGVGNGLFECVQDLTSFMELCIISMDDRELYGELFEKMYTVIARIWDRFLREFGDMYCVARFGDDLGYKMNTLLPPDDVIAEIIPRYARLVSLIHSYNKPFLLHSCGCIFDVMDEIITTAKIDAKHSNEDAIAPFPEWVERYGDRIGNFGGIDTDAVCRLSEAEMKEYITDVVNKCTGHGGFAFGSGNSIPDYVPVEGYLNMVNTLRTIRGE